MPVCPECGAENPEGAFSCRECGGSLTAGAARAPERPPGPPETSGGGPAGAPSEWTPDMAPPGPSRQPGQPGPAYVPPTRARVSPKLIGGLAGGLALLVAIIVVLVIVLSGGSGNPDEAIRMVKDHLEQQGMDPTVFKDWEASGSADDMEVSAIFDIGSLGEEYSEVPGGYYNQRFTWRVNLETGRVVEEYLGGGA